MALNNKNVNPGASTSGIGPKILGYSSADTLATIEAAGYFNALSRLFNTGDLLYVYSSAASGGGQKLYMVTSASGVVTLSTGTAIA